MANISTFHLFIDLEHLEDCFLVICFFLLLRAWKSNIPGILHDLLFSVAQC